VSEALRRYEHITAVGKRTLIGKEQVSGAPGKMRLHSVINNLAAGGATVTVWNAPDNAGDATKKIAVITPAVLETLIYEVDLSDGLTIEVAGAVVDITVVYSFR
jgi:hypothetical protein